MFRRSSVQGVESGPSGDTIRGVAWCGAHGCSEIVCGDEAALEAGREGEMVCGWGG